MIIALLFLILFAILFPGALRLLFVLLFISAIAVLGGAHATECDAFYLTGLYYRAADKCDHSWLARDGLKIMASNAAECSIPAKKAKALLKSGEDDFDTGVVNHGKAATCAYMDTEMKITENGK